VYLMECYLKITTKLRTARCLEDFLACGIGMVWFPQRNRERSENLE
jgi:hypothetical protein